MKKIFIAFISILISVNSNSQDFAHRKDNRPQNIQEDIRNNYQAKDISKITLLKALEVAGVRIFNFPISPAFDKEYNFAVNVNEYENNELVSSSDVAYTYKGKNIYVHWIEDSIEHKTTPFVDYISKLTFFTKDNDSTLLFSLETSGSTGKVLLKKKRVRNEQSYNFRTYSKVEWVLNKEIPLFVCASSWYDESIKMERFCGASDLSLDEKETKELLDLSSHYYVVCLKVFE